MSSRQSLLRALATLLLLLSPASCAGTTLPPTPTQAPAPAVRLTIAAVPAARGRLEQWIALYQADHPGAGVEVIPASAAQAQEALAQGQVDLAFLDQAPVAHYHGVLTATQVAEEAIAIVVHPGNSLHNLNAAVIVKLFSGTVVNWSQVGGDSKPVQVYLLPDSAGVVAAFARKAMAGQHLAPQAIVCPSPDSILRAVARDAGGIGLLLAGDASTEVTVLQVDGVRPADPQYPWRMPLFLAYGPASPVRSQEFCAFVRWAEGK